MAASLETQILNSLQSLGVADRPMTFNEMARQFGLHGSLLATVGRQLVDRGLAEPAYADVHGVRTMYGLLPQPHGPLAG